MNSDLLRWYSGKSLEAAKAALTTVEASVAHGSWLPNVSRKAKAAFNKQNVAKKWAEKNKVGLLGIAPGHDKPRDSRGWAAHHAMFYGYLGLHVDVAGLRANATTPEQLELVAHVEGWVKDFAELQAAVERLDATRPVPVFTTMKASPTVSSTLKSLGLAVSENTIRACPMKQEIVEYPDPKRPGKTLFKMVVTLDPPPGTLWHRSRYHCGHGQCEACGHAIRRPWNWVPLLLDNEAGVPHLLIVGMDCARTLFGVDVKGDLEILNFPKKEA